MPADSAFSNLFDVDPELGWRLREDDRLEAREHLNLPVTRVPVGAWSLAAATTPGRPLGMIVIDGVLLQEVQIGGRQALQILGPGDLVLATGPMSEALDVRLQWMATVESRVAVLDDRLQAPFSLWPGLALGLVERAGQQMARVAVQTAIAQLPRVDQRLEATFWQLADRWGRVTPAGIHIPLTLTHEVLARLVGGRRPTITLALTELADRGILVRHPDRTWLLLGRETTLPTADGERATPVLQLQVAAEDPRVAVSRWTPDAGRDLFAGIERLRQAHQLRSRQLALDFERYAAVRDRSRQLREAIVRSRIAMAEKLEHREALTRPPDGLP